ncbi:MAG: type II toxin-antitoxin system prevent-host-death family antitoxin [Cyanobacteria bacterium SZAS LIN-3]|nr:type II toxin-antitoxin system prevent-host-death family antitoxin [Cyanobacteria bacterium SZAS LIN-3]
MSKREKLWTIATAKARFSEVVDLAIHSGPQVVTRSGVDAVVVVSVSEWEKKTKRKGNLAEFLLSSPLRGSGIVIERDKSPERELDL